MNSLRKAILEVISINEIIIFIVNEMIIDKNLILLFVVNMKITP